MPLDFSPICLGSALKSPIPHSPLPTLARTKAVNGKPQALGSLGSFEEHIGERRPGRKKTLVVVLLRDCQGQSEGTYEIC